MATYTWIGGTSTNWSDINNWNSSPLASTAPLGLDDVIFVSTNNRPCTITAPSVCRTLTIDSGYNQRITLDADLVVGSNNTSLSNTGIAINGTPTFTGSGWLTLGGFALPSNKSISSSANVEIYRLAFNYGLGSSGIGQTANFSGSIIANNLNFVLQGQAASWGFAPNAQFILRSKINETALVTGDKSYGTATETPVPLLVVSGSVSWESGAALGCNMIIASSSIFRLTGSLGSTYQTLGSGLILSSANNLLPLTSRSLHVNANATILCTTASFLEFRGGTNSGTWNLHMSGSTTNIWNALRLNNLGGTGVGAPPGFIISSDIYLRKNITLQDPAESETTRPFPIGSLLLGGSAISNYVSSSNGAKIYVGGSIVGSGAIFSNFRSTDGGPKVIMYGTGHIAFPRPGTTNATSGFFLRPGIDLEISSSDGTIRWGNGNIDTCTIGHRISLTTPPTWSYTTAANYAALPSTVNIDGVPLVINFQNRPIWDLYLNGGAQPTLSSSLVLSGSFSTVGGVNNLNTSSLTSPSLTVLQNVQSLYTTGAFNAPSPVGQIRGNAPITMSGNLPATYSLLVPINNGRGNNILIDKPGGNLLITNPLSGSGTIPNETKTPIPLTYDSGTFKWIAGTVDASNSTLLLGNSASMDTTSNLSWYNITVSGSTSTPRGSLINIISPLVISNELNLGVAGNVTFTGSDTWTCSRLVCITPGRNIVLQDAVSNGQKAYTTTDFVNLSSSNAGSPIIMSSSATPTTRASWSVSFNSPPVQLYNVNGILIDSSAGRTIFTSGITQSTVNWNPSLAPSTPLSSLYTFFID
jgi:hypothetical protein